MKLTSASFAPDRRIPEEFTLYALDLAKCGVSGPFKGPDVLAAIRGQVLGRTTLTGVYALNATVKI